MEDKMGWLFNFLGSSIGKKQLMALTGLAFCGFLTSHLLGNLSMYGGPKMFDSYAEHLHAMGILINVAELGLVSLAVIHIGTALLLFIQNRAARPQRYAVSVNSGSKTLSSRLMPYTGLYLAAFITIHLLNFHFVDHDNQTISQIVSDTLTDPLYAAFYIFSMIVVALHVRHGLWSAFQTVGANHPKYMPFIQAASILFALAVAVGYGSLPILIMLTA
jgi:succinate dehydrogenase cytochrome b subunit